MTSLAKEQQQMLALLGTARSQGLTLEEIAKRLDIPFDAHPEGDATELGLQSDELSSGPLETRGFFLACPICDGTQTELEIVEVYHRDKDDDVSQRVEVTTYSTTVRGPGANDPNDGSTVRVVFRCSDPFCSGLCFISIAQSDTDTLIDSAGIRSGKQWTGAS